MISCKILISLFLLLLSETTQSLSVNVTVDTDRDYPKVSGLNLASSQYFPNIVEPLRTELGPLLEEIPIAGFWINSNDVGDSVGVPPVPITFSWNQSPQNFVRISLKYYFQYGTTVPSMLPSAELTFGDIPAGSGTQLGISQKNVWTVTEFYPILPVVGPAENKFTIRVARTQANTALSYFVLDSVTFQTDTAGADCRPENQNTFTPTVVIHGAYFYCYFNSDYSRWFVTWFMCPMVQDVQHVYCKSAQVCRAPSVPACA